MERYQVTFWNSVPAFMEMLAAEERNLTQALASLRTVVMGGDFLPVSLVKQLEGEKIPPSASTAWAAPLRLLFGTSPTRSQQTI